MIRDWPKIELKAKETQSLSLRVILVSEINTCEAKWSKSMLLLLQLLWVYRDSYHGQWPMCIIQDGPSTFLEVQFFGGGTGDWSTLFRLYLDHVGTIGKRNKPLFWLEWSVSLNLLKSLLPPNIVSYRNSWVSGPNTHYHMISLQTVQNNNLPTWILWPLNK